MFKPKGKFGQHWLEDEEILKKIVDAADIKPADTIVEIGAGTGNLTFFLSQSGADILALEKDRDLIQPLEKRFKRFKNVKIIYTDARFFDYASLPHPCKIVANLPYNLTSFLLRKILTTKFSRSAGVQELILMMQKEVAEKLVAPPGSSQRSILTLLVQIAGGAEILFAVPKEKFQPPPQVDSVLIKITLQNSWTDSQEKFFQFIKYGFRHKRRQLVNKLARLGIDKKISYNVLSRLKINPQSRAEDLSVKQWRELYEAVQNY